ncbi:alpha,alpha-trehalase TreA [Sodalis sp.]|uniref:alpha,alpha-trehalase TreA n=1 Tax=Sodalis sp. (in: enterobacteria) TaxID=1898979 RepID=UPI003872B150
MLTKQLNIHKKALFFSVLAISIVMFIFYLKKDDLMTVTCKHITDYKDTATNVNEIIANDFSDNSNIVFSPTIYINQPLPPDIIFGPLFVAVQQAKIYPDQKTFADAVPRKEPYKIISEYQQKKQQPDFDLKNFINDNFIIPEKVKAWHPINGQTLRQHIDSLWIILTRDNDKIGLHDSLLPLLKSYVVPGGRFREVYYWDSYFTMLGLAESGNWELVKNMIDNFSHQIDTYGYIPNGNRSYYLSRSQPPFFSFMVSLLATHSGDGIYARYLPQLKKEYEYWMQGSDSLAKGQASKRVVRLNDGRILNRYFDERDVPRTESYIEDIATATKAKGRPASEVYRDLRAGAASGWDFSSRWLSDPQDLSTIRTTAFIPVDLNSLLYHLEMTLSQASQVVGAAKDSMHYKKLAELRNKAINDYLWNEKDGYYSDYDWQQQQLTKPVTAATLFPLYVRIASIERARKTASIVNNLLLKPGGLMTTTINSGQQWDAPNGWAPLQWIAVEGLSYYGQDALAKSIGTRFLSNIKKLYDKKQKLFEKYIVDGDGMANGGEYDLQDGFGWTNGVTLMLLDKYSSTE